MYNIYTYNELTSESAQGLHLSVIVYILNIFHRDLLSANGKTDCQSSYDDHISFRGDGYAELGMFSDNNNYYI